MVIVSERSALVNALGGTDLKSPYPKRTETQLISLVNVAFGTDDGKQTE